MWTLLDLTGKALCSFELNDRSGGGRLPSGHRDVEKFHFQCDAYLDVQTDGKYILRSDEGEEVPVDIIHKSVAGWITAYRIDPAGLNLPSST